MATINGSYTFNSNIAGSYNLQQNVNFTSNGRQFSSITVSRRDLTCTYDNTKVHSSYGETTFQIYASYRTVDFGAEYQTVSDEFYNWISANATYTAPPTRTILVYSQNVISLSDNPTTILASATMSFTAEDGCVLPDSVEVFGAEHSWDKSTGTLTLNNPTDDVEIYIGYSEKYVVSSSSLIELARAIRKKSSSIDALTMTNMIATVKNL